MTAFLNTVLVNLKMALREPMVLFWNVAFPIFFLFVFGSVFGGGNPEAIGVLLGGLLCMSVMGTALFGIGSSLVSQREMQILRRFGAAPISPLVILGSEMVTGYLLALLASTLQVVLAVLIYKVQIHGNLLTLFVLYTLGNFAFMALGMTIGSLCSRVKTAMIASNALFFPFLFLGGAAVPIQVLPDTLQYISRLMASSYFVSGMVGVISRNEGLGDNRINILVMLATLVIGLLLCRQLFRWDSGQKLSGRRIGTSIALVVSIFVVGFLAKLGHAEPPLKPSPGAKAATGAGEGRNLLDDFEDGDLTSDWTTSWSPLADNQPVLMGTSESLPAVVADPDDERGHVLKVAGKVTRAARFGGGFAGVTLALNTTEDEPVDIRRYKGLRFRFRGDGASYRLVMACTPLMNFDQLSMYFLSSGKWRTIEIPFDSLRQTGFAGPREWTGDNVVALQILTVGTPHETFEFMLDDVEFYE